MVNMNLLVPNWWTGTVPSHVAPYLAYEVAWMDSDTEMRRGLFDELPLDSFPLATALQATPGGYRVVRYLARHPQLALTAGDLAFMVDEDIMAVREVLRVLTREGAVDIITNDTEAFYRLTSEPMGLVRVMDVCAWHTRWLDRLDRLAQALGQQEAA